MIRKPTTEEYKQAKQNGISGDSLYRRMKRGWDIDRAMTEQPRKYRKPHTGRELALYKGEELLAMGTLDQVAKELGVSELTILFYATPAYKRRLSGRKVKSARELVWLDEED